MPDPDVGAVLARIEAGLGYVGEKIAEVKDEQEKHRLQLSRVEHETTTGFGDLKTHVARVEERLSNHMQDDDRRFASAHEDITRAHRKIGTTAYPGGGLEAAGTKDRDEDAVRRGMIGTGIVGAIAALIYAAAEWIRAKLGGG